MINIAEILKDCPKGTKLYSPYYGECEFEYISSIDFIVVTEVNSAIMRVFDRFGKTAGSVECMLYPSKDQRDWTKFQRPFKDGDIIFYNDTIAIFKEWGDETLFRTYVCKYLRAEIIDENIPLFGKSVRREIRLATEEEKEMLFNAIKNNGYKWNEETKTLEKLIVPKFKIGDNIGLKTNNIGGIVEKIECDRYWLSNGFYAKFEDQDKYELVPNKFDINTLKPFDKVLVRDVNSCDWNCDIYSYYHNRSHKFRTIKSFWAQCIPYNEETKHLLGTTEDCIEYYKTW